MRVMAVHGFRGASWPREGSIVATVLDGGTGVQTCDDLSLVPGFAGSPWVDGRRGRMRAFGTVPVVVDDVALAAICVERGYARLEWAVLDWNVDAQGFYRTLGAVPMDEWTVWRLDGAALRTVGTPAV